MIRFKFLILVFLMALGMYSKAQEGWSGLDKLLLTIKAPEFKNTDYNIGDLGAKGDGVFDNTDAIRIAIEHCSSAGGGRVIIPKGVFLTGAIHLKSNVELYLSENSTLLFSRNPKKYLPLVLTRFEGNELMNYSPFIYAYRQENIAITGKGLLDGNADSTCWWSWVGNASTGWKTGNPDQNKDRLLLTEMSDNHVPVEKRIFGEGHYLRVNFIQFYQCKNILIRDVSIVRSPMWEINPVLSANITVSKVNIKSHGPNNDGCDPESCNGVLIEGCTFDTGDDCIAIKSGRDEDGRRIAVPSENIIIRNCTMKDGHGGVVIGSEISGDCRNVFVENCTMNSPGLDRALRIKSNSKRGGIIENIYMRNVTIGEVGQAVILADMYYQEGDVGKFKPVMRNIYIENVVSQKSNYALWLKGYERSPVSGIHIRNCRFNGVKYDNMLQFVNDLTFDNVLINDKNAIK